MSSIVQMFSLPPIRRAALALLVSGFCFPLSGVVVLRLNLVPMRYMLMHGVILGGAIALALSVNTMAVVVLLNLLLVWVLCRSDDPGRFSSAMMVATMAFASLVMHIWDVPAKDTLSLLWGSPYALTVTDLVFAVSVALCSALYLFFNRRKLVAIFFDAEIAESLGINYRFHRTVMVTLVSLVIALSMKLIGALLIDALLILPVVAALKVSRSTRSLFLYSSLFGGVYTISGFLLSLIWDLPLSGTIAAVAALSLLALRWGKKA